jgi:hypothetical protein
MPEGHFLTATKERKAADVFKILPYETVVCPLDRLAFGIRIRAKVLYVWSLSAVAPFPVFLERP